MSKKIIKVNVSWFNELRDLITHRAQMVRAHGSKSEQARQANSIILAFVGSAAELYGKGKK